MNRKTLIITLIVFLTLVLSSVFSYKMGLSDSGTYVHFTDAGLSANYQKFLTKNDDKKLLEFMETQINSSINLHRLTLEKQSFMSAFIGPLKEIKSNKEHYSNYYNLFEKRKNLITKARPEQVQKDVQWLSQNIQAK